jgi:hypothetical protein
MPPKEDRTGTKPKEGGVRRWFCFSPSHWLIQNVIGPNDDGMLPVNERRLFKCGANWNTIFRIRCYRLDSPAEVCASLELEQFITNYR